MYALPAGFEAAENNESSY